MNRLLVVLIACSLAGSSTFAFLAPKSGSLVHQPSRYVLNQEFSASTATLTRPHGRSHTTASKQTELSAFLSPGQITAIGQGIGKFYKASPMLAGFLTAGTKACFADSLAQYRDRDDTTTPKFDIKRNLAMVLYSGTILGLCCAIMYNQIFPVIFARETNPVLLAIKMTLFDGFINAPLIWLPPAYIAKALIYNKPKREALRKYATDVKENGLLKKYWGVWLPASLMNFLFVPVHFQVAFVAGVSFFWMILLSIVVNNGDDGETSTKSG